MTSFDACQGMSSAGGRALTAGVFPRVPDVKHRARRRPGLGPPGRGNTLPMSDDWWETVSGLQADMDAELREDAFDIFVVESARGRLVDRHGPVQVLLRSGSTVAGVTVPGDDSRLEGHLVLRTDRGREALLPVAAIVTMLGSRPGLRSGDEPGPARTPTPGITRRLRQAWRAGERVRVLTCQGRWIGGTRRARGRRSRRHRRRGHRRDHFDAGGGRVGTRLISPPGRRLRTGAYARTHGCARTAGR